MSARYFYMYTLYTEKNNQLIVKGNPNSQLHANPGYS